MNVARGAGAGRAWGRAGAGLWEALVVAAVILLALLYALQRWSPDWQQRSFYQEEFGPAVMYACGHGLSASPDKEEVQAFLQRRQQRLDCAALSAPLPDAPLNAFQAAHRYLLKTLGMAWRFSGVDWRVADHVVLGLYALSCALAYLLCRVWMPRACSLVATGLYAAATSHIVHLDHLRDYAKAPFVLGVLLGLSCLLARRRTLPQALAVSAAIGCALGVGVGFRMDLLIFVPFAMGMLIAFYPAAPRRAWAERLAASLLVIGVAYACAHPVLSSLVQGSNSAHVILLGLSQEHDPWLGLQSGSYGFSPHYNDLYQQVQIDTLAAVRGETQHVQMALPAYERHGYGLLFEYLRHFPADLWLRLVMAVVQGIGFDHGVLLPLPGADLGVPLDGAVALAAVAVALVAAWMRSLRLGLAALVAVLFLFGYPALQFHQRHFFHLSLLPIACTVALMCAAGGRILRWAVRTRWPGRATDAVPPARPSASFLVCMASLLVAPVLVWGLLWALQLRAQSGLVERALRMPVDWLSTQRMAPVPAAGGAGAVLTPALLDARWIRRLRSDPRGDPGNVLMGYYWVFDIRPSRLGCDRSSFRAALHYRAWPSFLGFSRTLAHAITQDTRILVPAVEMLRTSAPQGASTLASLDIEPAHWACVERAGVAAPGADFPLLMDLALPLTPGSAHLVPYRPAALSPAPPLHRQVAMWPAGEGPQERLLLARVAQAQAVAVHALDPAARSGAPGELWRTGRIRQRFSYAAQSGELDLQPGDAVVVSGTLSRGGLSVGLLKDGQWVHQLPVVRSSEFDVLLVPPPGRYQLVISNNVLGGATNDFRIHRLGIIRAAP